MVNRLMDLVVLVAELSQKSDKSIRELDKELLHRGYTSEEIEQALFWMSSQWRPVDEKTRLGLGRPVVRVLSPWESTCIDPEAHAYLLRLQALGIVGPDSFERIMNRVTPYGGEKLHLADVKSLAGVVLFQMSGEDLEDDLFQVFDDEVNVT